MKANMKLKNRYDKIASTSVYTLGFIGVIILSMIIFYVTSTGLSLVSWDTITGNSATINTNVYLDTGAGTYLPDTTLSEEIYYSET
jgi:ABC-type phosphate transport system permease subunit